MGIDQYPAESLVVPAVMDIRDKAAVNADYALTIADVRVWEQQHGWCPLAVWCCCTQVGKTVVR